MLPISEGYVAFRDYQTYYKIVGEQSDTTKLPLLIIAGGPGSPHNYLLDLQWIAESDRQVIFYDQLGCGKSDQPDDVEWTIELFVGELHNLRQALRLDEIHLLGHSWGGMLAIEYLLAQPEGVRSAVLASSMVSMPLFMQEMHTLRRALPGSVRKTLEQHERNSTTDSVEYQAAYNIFFHRHIFRPEHWPPHLNSPPDSFGKTVYNTMWGPSEAYIDGTLKTWNRLDDLSKLTLPVLITSGRYDELTPRQANETRARIPHAQQVIFEHSAHLPHAEEPSAYRRTVEQFLDTIEHD